MFKNNLKIAVRTLIKNKTFSVINIGGLALSLAAFWLIALFVADELSYDRYHENADRIYRVVSHGKWDGGSMDITGTSGPTAPSLKLEYPEVEQAVRISAEGGGVISYGLKKITQDRILFTDSNFFSIFTYPLLAGNPKTALSNPQCIVLTKTLALTLFGSVAAALNKTVNFESNYPNLVTGVINDVPKNSHFSFTALRSFPKNYTTDVGNLSMYTYILLKPNADVKKLQAKLPAFAKKYLQELLEEIEYSMELQPLLSIHLHSKLSYELGENRSMKYVYILSTVGLLIVLIAFINYVNITTARASVRLREIAIRKIVGSNRKKLVELFLSEAVLVIIVAAALSALLVAVGMPYFNNLTGKSLEMWRFGLLESTTFLIVFSLTCGLIGGLYPALFLSGFKTIPSLKNQMGNQNGQVLFRKSLVVFQFTVTVILIAVSIVIYSQLNYVSNKDLGFNKNQVLTFHLNGQQLRNNIPALRRALMQNSQIINVASAGNPIGNNNIGQLDYGVEMNDGAMNNKTNLGYGLLIDEDFIPTMQIKLAEGRNFSRNLPSDSSQSVIVNQALVRKAGWKNAICKKVRTDTTTLRTVIGVVRDFHIYSLQHPIEPMIFQLPKIVSDKDNIYVRIAETNVSQTMKFIEKTFLSFDKESPFEYQFLDQNFSSQYAAEQRHGQVLLSFTILTICIACLGLFGLITFTSEQRKKEIGVRKVLGASVGSVVKLLSTDLIRLVIASVFIAAPIAWFLTHQWLQDFAYRINIEWWMFALAGVLAVVIAFLTVSFQAIKAGLANPVESLRTE